MKDEGLIIALVIGAVVLLFWATSTGVLRVTGGAVPIGQTGIVAPQPSQNYSGFLAASTAPGVSNALNSILGGLGTTVGAWLSPGRAPTPAVGSGGNVNSPSAAAQPYGPDAGAGGAVVAQGTGTPIGPIIDPGSSYDATLGSAFDFSGLSSANAFDPNYSLFNPAES